MKDLILENAFGILGILPDTSQKEITKRGKEISKLIKFGEKSVYPFDFDFYSSNRNDSTITEAVNELSSVKTHILHSFFRTYPISDKEKQEILTFEKKQNIDEKLSFVTENKVIKERNQLLLLLILLRQSNKKSEYKKIFKHIKNILNNFTTKETLISDFKKIYKLSDELGIDDAIFNTIKEDIGRHLLEIFSNIATEKKDDDILYSTLEYLLSYLSSYKIIPQLANTLENVIDIIDQIEALELENSENGLQKLKELLEQAQEMFNQCIDKHIFETVIFIEYRDKFCKILSEKSVKYFNQTHNVNIAKGLIQVAQTVGGSLSVNQHLKEAINTLDDIKKDETEPFAKLYLKKGSEYPVFCLHNYKIKIYTKMLFGDIKCEEFQYDNIDGYCFSITRNSVNGIPTGTSYNLTIVCDNKHYNYSCSTSGWGFDDSKKTDFSSILGAMDKIVGPLIINKIIHKVFDLEEDYSIGNLRISKDGLHSSGLFSDSFISWSELKYKPSMSNGNIVILNNKGKRFIEVALSWVNAPVIPELFKQIIEKRIYM